MIVHARRENVFEKAERRWFIDADGLRRTIPGQPDPVLAWAEVVELRLTYAPTRFKPWRHKLTLRSRRETWVIDNVHFKGVGDFEDRSATFNPLVLACVERVREAAPGAIGRLGSAPLAYWAQLIFVTAAFALLAMVIVAFPVNFSGLIWVKLGLIVVSLPVLFGFAIRSWPRRAPLDAEAFRKALPTVRETIDRDI